MNSTNRAEQGIAYLQEFLGDLVGQPLTVHESMESLLEQHAEHDPPLAEPIEVPELVTAHLDQHYKQVLDEPVPALNNKTPRECTQGGVHSDNQDERSATIKMRKEMLAAL